MDSGKDWPRLRPEDKRLVAAFKVVHQRRDRLVGKRVNIGNQRNEHEEQRLAIGASTQKILNAAEALLSKHQLEFDSSSEYRALQTAIQESTDLAARFNDTELKLQQAAQFLNLKESELHKKETKVYKRLAYLTGFKEEEPWVVQPQPTYSASNAFTDDTTPPRARKYYDKAGDVKLLRERIHNMQVQRRQDLSVRQIRREPGHIARITERKFHERFYAKLGLLLQELEGAKKDAILLKLACERQGIVLEEDETDFQDNHDFIDAPFEDDRRILSNLAGQNNDQSRLLLLGELLSGFMDPATKIRRWLNSIPANAQAFDPQLPGFHEAEDSKPHDESAINFSNPVPPPPARTDVPVPFAARVNANFLARETTRALSLGEPFATDGTQASELSGGSPTSSDREYGVSEVGFAGDAPARRYSDPALPYAFLLRSDSLQMVSYMNEKQQTRSPRSYSR